MLPLCQSCISTIRLHGGINNLSMSPRRNSLLYYCGSLTNNTVFSFGQAVFRTSRSCSGEQGLHVALSGQRSGFYGCQPAGGAPVPGGIPVRRTGGTYGRDQNLSVSLCRNGYVVLNHGVADRAGNRVSQSGLCAGSLVAGNGSEGVLGFGKSGLLLQYQTTSGTVLAIRQTFAVTSRNPSRLDYGYMVRFFDSLLGNKNQLANTALFSFR